MTKLHDQGHLWKEVYNWIYSLGGLEFMMVGQRKQQKQLVAHILFCKQKAESTLWKKQVF